MPANVSCGIPVPSPGAVLGTNAEPEASVCSTRHARVAPTVGPPDTRRKPRDGDSRPRDTAPGQTLDVECRATGRECRESRDSTLSRHGSRRTLRVTFGRDATWTARRGAAGPESGLPTATLGTGTRPRCSVESRDEGHAAPCPAPRHRLDTPPCVARESEGRFAAARRRR
jgi:hypothetical protein